jgi:hypothetical protein
VENTLRKGIAMGQAKRRGTFEERRAAAMARRKAEPPQHYRFEAPKGRLTAIQKNRLLEIIFKKD